MSRKLFTPYLVIILVAFLLVVLRFEQALYPKDELRQFRDTARIIELKGVVVAEPDKRINNTKLKIRVLPYSEYILITTNNYSQYQYGDKLKLKGHLLTPKEYEDFNYKNYLRKDKILSVMYYPEIKLLGRPDLPSGGYAYKRILEIKAKLRNSLYRSLASPQNELLGAIILGDKSRLSQKLKDVFSRVGIRHITAISGMHITIMTLILTGFFASFLHLGWNKAFYFVLATLVFYIVMIGFPASAVRAGIMAGVLLLSQKTGRMYLAPYALVLAGAVMLIHNPLLLFYDVGFQLSFLAVLGIIYLSPVFNYYLAGFIKSQKLKGLRSIISITLSAQIFTLPILIYNFGIVSLAAPITNVLIVPWLSLVLIFGFLGILAGLFSQLLGTMVAIPAFLLSSYVLLISSLFDRLPLSSLTIKNLHWAWLIVFYIFLIWAVKKLRKVVES